MDLLLISVTIAVVSMSIVSMEITIIAIAVISIGILSMSIVSIFTMPRVAVPVSICYVIVNKGAIFIFTELADEFRFQRWKKK